MNMFTGAQMQYSVLCRESNCLPLKWEQQCGQQHTQ